MVKKYFWDATVWGRDASMVRALTNHNNQKQKSMNTRSPHLILILVISLFFTSLRAQKQEDVVYLNNGSIIHGTLVTGDTSRISIINNYGDTWVFSREEVDSVSKQRPFEYNAMLFNKKGFELGTNAELMVRSGANAIGSAIVPGINLLLGYRVNSRFSAGLRTGLEFFDYMEIPVCGEIRYRAVNRALSPVIYFRSGYSFPAESRPNDYQYSYSSSGGYSLSTGIGIGRVINENASFLFTFGYGYQELNYHLSPLYQWLQERDRTEYYSRLRISLGYFFK